MSAIPFPPLFTEAQIKQRVKSLASEIESHYRSKELVAIGILQGSFIFFSDLVKEISTPLRCEFLGLSSYEQPGSSGEVKIILDIEETLEGKDLLLIEDLVDTGLTLRFIERALKARNPRSLKTCSLLWKKSAAEGHPSPDFIGFEINDAFVVGYGIDHDGRYREMPYIGVMKPRGTQSAG